MKVVHLIFSLGVGGAETMLVDIVNKQCKLVPVTVVVINDNVNNKLLSSFSEDVQVISLGRKRGSRLNFLFILRLWLFIWKERPLALHCHNNTVFPLIQFWRNKAFLTVHDTRTSMKYLKRFKKVFAISNAVAQDIKARIDLNAQVIYNGINIRKYNRRKHHLLSKNEEFKVIQISRLIHEKKGQDIAILAMAALIGCYPDLKIRLYLVGDGDSKMYLEELAKKSGIETKISFLGQVDRQWVEGNLCDFHLLIQPSRYEGFGLTIIEGLAAGLPVIVSDLDGPAEIMNSLNVKALCAAGDSTMLKERIFEVYKLYSEGQTTSLLSDYSPKSSSLEIFDIQNTAQNYLNAYI